MPTNRRFYPEWALQPMSSVLFWAYVEFCFSKNWQSLVTKELHSLLAFDQISIFLNRPFGFSIQEPPFVVKLAFLGFQLDLYFFVFFFHFCFIFLWFKLRFQVFTLNLYLFFFFNFACQSHPFRFSTLTRRFSCHFKHNTSLLCRHWWNPRTPSHPSRWVSMPLLRKPFSQHRALPSWVTIFHGGSADFGESVWALALLFGTVWVESFYRELSLFSFDITGHGR